MKQVMMTGILVFLVLALFSCTTISPSYSNDPATASGISESPLFPTGDESSAAEEMPAEPPAWTHILLENYAVYQIIGKADETMQFPEWDGMDLIYSSEVQSFITQLIDGNTSTNAFEDIFADCQ